MYSTMAPGRPACATASIPSRLIWTRINSGRDDRPSGRGAGTSGQFCGRIAVPNAQQQDLATVWILEDVIDVFDTAHLKKSRPARIRAGRRTDGEQSAQLGQFLLGMTSQIFQNGRL